MVIEHNNNTMIGKVMLHKSGLTSDYLTDCTCCMRTLASLQPGGGVRG